MIRRGGIASSSASAAVVGGLEEAVGAPFGRREGIESPLPSSSSSLSSPSSGRAAGIPTYDAAPIVRVVFPLLPPPLLLLLLLLSNIFRSRAAAEVSSEGMTRGIGDVASCG